MKVGDVLVYGDGTKAAIAGFPKINGEPGVLVEPEENPLGLSDILHRRARVERWLELGVWSLEEARG